MSSIVPATARLTFRAAEPIHGMIYFTPHGPTAYAAIGITDRRMGYFASRSAAMGPVPAGVTIATFFNFSPAAVRRAIPAAWQIAEPAAVLSARLEAADRSLRQAWGDEADGPSVREAASLARTAAERAGERPQGRPLFAAHAGLPWPEEPHLVLWHAQSLLREYRGDGHVSLLLTEGLSGLEALVVHAATGEIPGRALQASREWSDAEWAAGVESVRERGWLEDAAELKLNAAGREHRQSVEDRTDELAVYGYQAIGEDGCARLRDLVRPLVKAVVAADLGFPALLAARYRPDSA
jgi:hypothetical protein